MSRESTHNKIDELLGQISIHNNRLSLHTEKLSQLDIDVLRKQCIELYEQINVLALEGKKMTVASKPAPPKKAAVKQEPIVEVEVNEPQKAPEPEIKQNVKKTSTADKKKEKPKATKKRKIEEDEIQSLFEKFSSTPIKSIAKAISVAKRFEFQSNFFDGDASAYTRFVKDLDGCADREEAFQLYHETKSKYNWENEELRDELKALLYRKFA